MQHDGRANLKPPWTKGQSGNPGGRPKVPKLSSLLADVGLQEDARGRTQLRQLAEVIWAKALSGDVQYTRILLDRLWGPVALKITEADPDLRAALAAQSLAIVMAAEAQDTAAGEPGGADPAGGEPDAGR